MALYTCPDCHKVFSSEAKSCPHCGWRQKSGFGTGCAIAVVLVAAVIVGLMILGASSPQVSTDPDIASACFEAHEAVTRSLVSPTSAEFPTPCTDQSVKRNAADGTVTVFGYVDADNEFGAKIRDFFSVDMTKQPDGSWESKKPVLIPPDSPLYVH